MKVFIEGGGAVTLTQQNFIAKGGEGQIFGKGDLAYKIYFDPDKLIPKAKIRELKALVHPNILPPQHFIYNDNHLPIGFTMDWVKKTLPLCRLFTNDFCIRQGVSKVMIVDLISNLRSIIDYIHQAHCFPYRRRQTHIFVKN